MIDFKTDAVIEGDETRLEELLAYYRPQIAAYRRAAAHGLGLPLDAVSARLVFLGAGVSRHV